MLFMMKYIIGIFLVASPVYGMMCFQVAYAKVDQEHQQNVKVAQAAHDEQPQGAVPAQGSIMVHINPKGVKLTEAEYNRLLAKMTREPAKIAGQKTIHSIEMKSYRYREALLPALFLWRPVDGFSNMLEYMAERIERTTKVYLENKAIARILPSKTILSVIFLSKIDQTYTSDLRNLETDYIKIVGRKLCQNEVAIIGYADGTHEFKLSEVDRSAANSLSHDQLDFVIELYRAHDASLLVRSKRYEAILSSLPLNMQITLATNYKIPLEWFMEEGISDIYQKYEKITEELEEAKRQKAIIERDRVTIRDQISYEKRDHERAMENARANQAQRKEELRNRPFWKRHGRIMLATVAAFTIGWLGKCYWSSVSSGISSWFRAVKSKYGYR